MQFLSVYPSQRIQARGLYSSFIRGRFAMMMDHISSDKEAAGESGTENPVVGYEHLKTDRYPCLTPPKEPSMLS